VNHAPALLACLLTACLLAARSSPPIARRDGSSSARSFSIKELDAGGVPNLSFERAFGKLIGLQDTLAKIIEDKSNRAICFGVVNVASMVFLPI